MAKPTGFLENTREVPAKEAVDTRTKHYRQIYKDEEFGDKMVTQASRCMDCGVPFCHSGCPLGNIIPEFNDAVYRESWTEAYEILSSTNNFPEFTGRICPAPCEHACVLGINQPAVTIHNIERFITEEAYKSGDAGAKPPEKRTGKKVAVVGSGPAGLSAAAQLNKAGHSVVVFERAKRIGGLLRQGIPDFKLEKWVIDRKQEVMEEEGIEFKTNTNVGVDVSAAELKESFDAIILAGGSTVPRDLPIEGRDADGVHFAMDFLSQNNSAVAGDKIVKNHRGEDVAEQISAEGKHVVVIGGGDTGSDCIGTSIRHGAKSVTQLEIMPRPPEERTASMPWPNFAFTFKTSTSQEEIKEGGREFAVGTKEFIKDENGKLKALKIVDIEHPGFKEVEGSEREIPCELATLAMGFLHPQHEGLLTDLGVELDERGNVKAEYMDHQTSETGIFVAGDMRRGQSLVVWAQSEGREAAAACDEYLMGSASTLERKADSFVLSK